MTLRQRRVLRSKNATPAEQHSFWRAVFKYSHWWSCSLSPRKKNLIPGKSVSSVQSIWKAKLNFFMHCGLKKRKVALFCIKYNVNERLIIEKKKVTFRYPCFDFQTGMDWTEDTWIQVSSKRLLLFTHRHWGDEGEDCISNLFLYSSGHLMRPYPQSRSSRVSGLQSAAIKGFLDRKLLSPSRGNNCSSKSCNRAHRPWDMECLTHL